MFGAQEPLIRAVSDELAALPPTSTDPGSCPLFVCSAVFVLQRRCLLVGCPVDSCRVAGAGAMAFIPPHEDLLLCAFCGSARLNNPEAWHGWWCFECENAVAWMEPENQALVFIWDAVYIRTGHGRCTRCHDTRGSVLHRAAYTWCTCFQ